MSDSNCYFCRRSEDEVTDLCYAAMGIDRGGEAARNAAARKELDAKYVDCSRKLASAQRESEDLHREFLNLRDLRDNASVEEKKTVNDLQKLLKSEVFKKYPEWTRKKLDAALECDYPFKSNESKMLDTILSMDVPGDTVGERRAFLDNKLKQTGDSIDSTFHDYQAKIDDVNRRIQECQKKILALRSDFEVVRREIATFKPFEATTVSFSEFKVAVPGFTEMTVKVCPVCASLVKKV